MGTTSISLKVRGLGELVAALKKVAPETRRELVSALKQVGKVVADDTKGAMPKRSGAARRTVKVKVVTRRGADGVVISEGGAVAPYVPWLDFGGSVGRGRTTTKRVTVSRHAGGRIQVHARSLGGMGTGSVTRRFSRDGRYLYPALARHTDDMERAVAEAVATAVTSAGLEVTR